MKKEYIDQAALLIEILPYIAKEPCFAIKSGTTINLFYWQHQFGISNALSRAGFSSDIQGQGIEKKLIVSNHLASIKIEPNYANRGYVYEPIAQRVFQKGEEEYGYAEIKTVSWSELLGGKVCAALDRQHPRDSFDIAGMLSDEKQDENLMNGFIAMLLGHGRSVHELLDPVIRDRSEVFHKEFWA